MNIYTFSKGFFAFLFKIFSRWEIRGIEHVPLEGPIILASNHRSNLDPVVIAAAAPRKLSFLAKEELFRIPLVSWYIKQFDSLPVKRGSGDRGAFKAALKALEEGKVFAIFPEGTRSKTKELLPPKPGVAMIALKAKVPVVPVAISGTERLGGKIRVTFGEPLFFDTGDQKASRQDLERISEEIMMRIKALLQN